MSYSSAENSASDGQPIELYEFIGTYRAYYYTSSDVPIVFRSNTYSPSPVHRAAISTGTQVDDNVDCQLDVPFDSDIAQDYAFTIPAPDLSMNIWRFHRGQDPSSAILFWSGKVTNFSCTNHIVTIQIPTFFAYALRGNIPNVCYQTVCNHVLFDARCKVSRAANQFTSTIGILSGTSLTLGTIPPFPDGSFVGGECFDTIHNERRMILSQIGAGLRLSYPFSKGVVPGDGVQITIGCNHVWSGDCLNRHNNQVNFGGFPFTPQINPFTGKF